ncbi:hypothetical protein GIB67_031183 [Kingdonia uniflora]|uniref:Uncharacterized protein n=1 Tax=Kingdonia uniflora TaxID=39325 RepID=A0A7J7NKQ5_9MAGN|nr:hypothetical protein GIB67_031183 [Kingdonia uniflora]
MAFPAPVPLTYRGLSGEEAVEAEEDFYYKWKFYIFVLTSEERWAWILSLGPLHLYQLYGGSGYRTGGDGSGGGDLAGRSCRGISIVVLRSEDLPSCFVGATLKSTQRERQKIRGIDQELSEDNKRLKRAKGLGSRRWVYNSVVRGKLDFTADSHPDTEDLEIEKRDKGIDESISLEYFDGDVRGVKSTVERKKSLIDEVVEEETELKLVLGELGLSRKKRVNSRSKKVTKAQSTRSMTGVDEGKRQTSEEEVRAKTPGEVTQGKRRRVKPLEGLGEKVAEGQSASVDDLKEVAHLVKGIWLSIEEQEAEVKKVKSELEKNLAQAKTDALKEVNQLKVAHAVAIGHLQVEAKANLGEMAEEHDRLGHHFMLKGYSQKEVVREMSLGINNQEPGLAKERETSKALLSAQAELQIELDASRIREDHALMCNQEFTEQFDRMKQANENREDQYVKAYFRLEKLNQAVPDLTRQVEEKDFGIKKGLEDLFEATERAENLQRQGHVQKGNTNLRECQHKLDVVLIRERVLEGEIRAKDLLVKRKDELLKDLLAREELNTKIMKLRTRVVELEAINLAESKKYIAKLEADVIYHDRADTDIIAWKDTCAMLKACLERLKVRFATSIIPNVSQTALLSVIVAYFEDEVKRLESERDTLLKTLLDKGCTYGAKIDRDNYLGAMETQLGPRTAESVERGKVVVAHKLKDRPLDDLGESIVDTPSA